MSWLFCSSTVFSDWTETALNMPVIGEITPEVNVPRDEGDDQTEKCEGEPATKRGFSCKRPHYP